MNRDRIADEIEADWLNGDISYVELQDAFRDELGEEPYRP